MTSISPKIFEDLGDRIEKDHRKRGYITRFKSLVSKKTLAIVLGLSVIGGSLDSCSLQAQEIISQEIDGYEAEEVTHAQSIIQSVAFQKRMTPFLEELSNYGIYISDELGMVLSDLFIAERDKNESALEYIGEELRNLQIPEKLLIQHGFQAI